MYDATAPPPTGPILYLLFCLAWIALFAGFGMAVFFPWMRAQASELPVSMTKIAGLRLKFLPVGLLLDALIQLRQEGNRSVQIEQLVLLYRERRRDARTADALARLYREQAPTQA